ncbi:MAG: hypothetical protein ACREV7_20565 [Steroidobacteraceae bacterium]
MSSGSRQPVGKLGTATRRMPETFEQLDELLVILGANLEGS